MITFVIFTYNEEARIERVINNFKNYGKVLIADNNSNDKTHEIALRHGCEIYIRTKDYVFVENQELVNELYKVITTEWIYWGFADEMLDGKTLEKIQSLVYSGKYSLINIVRKNYFYGNFCGDLYASRTFKLFKKHAINFTDNQIHSMGKATVLKEEIFNLSGKYFIHHFISNTASSYLNVINRYTTQEIEGNYEVKTSFTSLIILFLKVVIKDFFITRGFKAGFSSIALSELMLFYAIIKNMKKYEHLHGITTSKIEKENNIYRDKIIKSISYLSKNNI